LIDCPFTVDAGSYNGIRVLFDRTYEVLVDDPVNGFFTDPTSPAKIVTGAAPAGGAQFVSITARGDTGTNGEPTDYFSSGATLAERVTLTSATDGGATAAISVVINQLQYLPVTVAGGAATFDFSGNAPGNPDTGEAIGDVARLGYYVRPEIGTALTYNTNPNGQPTPQGTLGVSVNYTTASTPTFLFHNRTGPLGACGPVAAESAINSPRIVNGAGTANGGYLGRDSTGTLGWAQPSDPAWTMYGAEFAMADKSTIGDTTTLLCKTLTTDPAPPGGTFASGAPVITAADYQQVLILVAN
jgi:hypothetical protein